LNSKEFLKVKDRFDKAVHNLRYLKKAYKNINQNLTDTKMDLIDANRLVEEYRKEATYYK
jgi:hypothetical protein